MKVLLFTIVLVFFGYSLSATEKNSKTDSLLDEVIHFSRPYLIINVTSTDCISCRGAASATIARLKSKVDPRKIALLTDSKGMSVYFNQFPEIYSAYKIFYNEELSRNLSGDGKSKLCYVDNQGISTFSLPADQLNIDSLAKYFTNVPPVYPIESDHSGLQTLEFKDSILGKDVSYIANKNYDLLFSDPYQIGILRDAAGTRYVEPQITDTCAKRLYELLRKFLDNDFQTVSETRKTLVPLTMPLLYIRSFQASNESCAALIKLNTAYRQPSSTPNDKRIAVFGRFFIARTPYHKISYHQMNTTFNPFLITDKCDFSWIDTLTIGKNMYMPVIKDGFDLVNDTVYLSLIKTDNKGIPIDQDEVFIGRYKFENNSKLRFIDLFTAENYKRPNYLIVTHDESSIPVIFNKDEKELYLFSVHRPVSLKDSKSPLKDIALIYDIAVKDSLVRFVGGNNGIVIDGTYNWRNGDLKTKRLAKDGIADAKIVGDSVYTYSRHDEHIAFEEY